MPAYQPTIEDLKDRYTVGQREYDTLQAELQKKGVEVEELVQQLLEREASGNELATQETWNQNVAALEQQELLIKLSTNATFQNLRILRRYSLASRGPLLVTQNKISNEMWQEVRNKFNLTSQDGSTQNKNVAELCNKYPGFLYFKTWILKTYANKLRALIEQEHPTFLQDGPRLWAVDKQVHEDLLNSWAARLATYRPRRQRGAEPVDRVVEPEPEPEPSEGAPVDVMLVEEDTAAVEGSCTKKRKRISDNPPTKATSIVEDWNLEEEDVRALE